MGRCCWYGGEEEKEEERGERSESHDFEFLIRKNKKGELSEDQRTTFMGDNQLKRSCVDEYVCTHIHIYIYI